jgi:hypothetical protein
MSFSPSQPPWNQPPPATSNNPYPYQPPPPVKQRKVWPAAVGAGIVGLLLGGAAGGVSTDPTVTPNPTTTVTAPAKPGRTVTKNAPVPTDPVKGKVLTTFGSGDWVVGRDVKAGTYVTTTVNVDGGACYWERAKDSSNELGSIIANDNVERSRARVDIKDGEIFKTTEDCGTWVRE